MYIFFFLFYLLFVTETTKICLYYLINILYKGNEYVQLVQREREAQSKILEFESRERQFRQLVEKLQRQQELTEIKLKRLNNDLEIEAKVIIFFSLFFFVSFCFLSDFSTQKLSDLI